MSVFRLPAILALLLAVSPALAGIAPALAQEAEPADEVVATVDGSPIRYSDLAMADEEMGAALAQLEPQVRFQYLLGMLVDRRVVAMEARKKHVDDDPAVQRRQEYYGEKALRDVYWVQLMQDKVTDEAIEAWYEKNIVAAPAEREAHARHIIAESEQQAAKIAAEIKDGKSFDAAAEEYRAPGSSGDDGDLGWFRREDMVPEIAEPVFSMKPGDVSGPVQTQFGWHVIQLVGFRDLPKPGLEEAHEEIVRRIARDEGQKLMEKLRADAKIEIIGAESAAPSSGRPQLVLPAQE
ncbi:MAG: peptidylprolyl isomerase [Parvibaculum sp.]|jgi:peptidyl-prolyl cis-trans isomerase C|uniref:peptidylprolyl isomerase n=1 Tax=Parvibaculum sp. TaxID=2024848 RepID=UPI002ABAC512|nr:peptidylprolyl isomerase [Parvibaculum sp.]MDZ4381933.1 peptidylprolyl isomerase [Parvibaculum sp.]